MYHSCLKPSEEEYYNSEIEEEKLTNIYNNFIYESKIIINEKSIGKSENQNSDTKSHNLYSYVPKKITVNAAVSMKIKSYKRSQSIKLVILSSSNQFSNEITNFIPNYLSKRGNSLKRPNLRKILSIAQFSKILERFNCAKFKLRRVQSKMNNELKLPADWDWSNSLLH